MFYCHYFILILLVKIQYMVAFSVLVEQTRKDADNSFNVIINYQI